MTTLKRFVLGFMSACVLLCGCVMFAGNAEAATLPKPPVFKQTHNTYPHLKRLKLSPTFHHGKVKSVGKWKGYKMVKKWSYKAQKYVMVRVPVIKETKLKLGKVPKVVGVKVHKAKVYKAPKVKGFKVPVWKGKGWTVHNVVYRYRK